MEEGKELVELRDLVRAKEKKIASLEATIEQLRKEVVELRKKLEEPVVLTSRGIREELESKLTAADVLVALRKEGRY